MTTDPLVVTRIVALGGAPTDVEIATVASALAALPGMHAVQVGHGGRRVKVSYDLRRLRLDDVEKTAAAAGGVPARGLFAALWRNWAAFTEENKLACVRAEVRPCCSRPPDGEHH
jgi:hypothetical protein